MTMKDNDISRGNRRALIGIAYIVTLAATLLLALPGFLFAESAPQQAAAAAPAVIGYVIARAIEKLARLNEESRREKANEQST